MSGRPEGSDFGGYDSIQPEINTSESWQEFTPWRPGERPTTERMVREPSSTERAGFKWSEDQPESFDVGDRVANIKPVGGLLGGSVLPGTIGEVVSTRLGMFDEHVTVKFSSGLAEEIKPQDIEHKGWF